MTDQASPAKGDKPADNAAAQPDPEEWARIASNIGERSQRLLTEFLERSSRER